MADAILSLSPAEIYSLAVVEARALGQTAPDTYSDAIRLATGRIRGRLGLPEFEEWVLEHRENPEEFDPYMIGFWKSEESDPREGS